MTENRGPGLDTDVVSMLVKSVTNNGSTQLTELEAERLLNAIARAMSGVPTGVIRDTRS